MTFNRIIATAAQAGLLLALSATSASAIEAAATAAVNVRLGPSTFHGVVDQLYPGEIVVDVNQCNAAGTWCHIFHDGPDGWVSRAYLGAPGASSGVQFNVVIPLPGGGSITFGTGGATVNPGGSGSGSGSGAGGAPQVCFYAQPNFGGASTCVPAGTTDGNVTGFWDDRVSSIQMFGGAKVRLFQDHGFCGGRNVFVNNVANLGAMLNNKASAYQTWTGTSPAIPPCDSSGGSGGGSLPPAVISAGSIHLQVARWADLENGNTGPVVPITPVSADFFYERVDASHRYLKPLNGARFARGDMSNRGYEGCATETYSSSHIPLPAMPAGSYICVRTHEGHIGQIRITSHHPASTNLTYTTFGD